MRIDRLIRAGALFAESVSSIRELERQNYTVNGNPTIVDSPYGHAIAFDGTGDWVDIGDASFIGSAKSVIYRVYHPSISGTDAHLALVDSSHYLESVSGVLTSTGFVSPTLYVDGAVGTALTAGAWHSIGMTTGTGVAPTLLQLGTYDGAVTFGTIRLRDLILFDRELSAAEMLGFAEGTLLNYMQIIYRDYDVSGAVTYAPFSSAQKTKITANTKSDDSALGLTTIQLAAWNAEKDRL